MGPTTPPRVQSLPNTAAAGRVSEESSIPKRLRPNTISWRTSGQYHVILRRPHQLAAACVAPPVLPLDTPRERVIQVRRPVQISIMQRLLQRRADNLIIA